MKVKKKFYATDGANKKGRHMVVKICSFWYNDRVVPLLLDEINAERKLYINSNLEKMLRNALTML